MKTICERCKGSKIVYRIYPDNGTPLPSPMKHLKGSLAILVCQPCAEFMLQLGLVFNLRRVLCEKLGTSRRKKRAEEE